MRIDRVEVRVVGPQAQRFTWSHDLPEQYMTNEDLEFAWFEAPLMDYDLEGENS